MSRLTGQADYCRWRAEACRIKAAREAGQLRSEYRNMAKHWENLAKTYALAEEISGFIQWNAQRIEPPSAFGV